jgi:HipA-like kinase
VGGAPGGTVPQMPTPIGLRLRDVAAIRYVTPLREGGSLPGLVEADDDGLYVVKFRGAGQGLRALIAEVIVGELARRLGLLVPDLVTVEIDPVLGAAEPDPEIQELITGSAGANLGVDFLPGALPYSPAGPYTPDGRLAADVVWLDALTTNVDRTPRNPNLLLWHDRLWLIDHGAALYLQHGGLDPAQHADRPFPLIKDHVLLPHAGSILEAHERLARVVEAGALVDAVALVPEEWLASVADGDSAETYVDYLRRRLESGSFAEEAERARAGA